MTDTAKEYLAARKQRLDAVQAENERTAAAQAALSQEYLSLSSTPGQYADLFSSFDFSQVKGDTGITNLSDLKGIGVARQFDATGKPVSHVRTPVDTGGKTMTEHYAEKKSEYTRLAEQVHSEARGQVAFQTILDWNPEDLRLIGQLHLAQEVENWQIQEANRTAYEAGTEAMVQDAIHKQENSRNFVHTLMTQLSSGMSLATRQVAPSSKPIDVAAIRKDVEALRAGTRDKLFNKQIGEWRKYWTRVYLGAGKGVDENNLTPEDKAKLDQREAEIRAGLNHGANPDEMLNPNSPLRWGAKVAGTVLGGAIKGAVSVAGTATQWSLTAVNAPFRLVGGTGPLDRLEKDYKEKMDAQAQAIEDQGKYNGPKAEGLADQQLQQAWDRMQTENPEVVQEAMQMAGYDPLKAFAFWAEEQKAQPAAKEQVQNIKEALDKQDYAMIDQLRESDFRISGKMMDVLGWYGSQVSAAATGLTLLVSDQDLWQTFRDAGVADGFGALKTSIEANERKPSEALGIDGSLLGLAYDLGITTLVDPMTWIFGHRAGVARSAAPRTAEDIAREMSSPLFERHMLDLADAAMSPSKGAGTIMTMTAWMPAPLQARMFHALGYTENVLLKEPWRKLPGATEAMEVKTSFLDTLPSQATAKGFDAAKAAEKLGKTGFEDFGSVQISRLTGEIRLDHGAEMLAAAKEAGVSHMPIEVRIVDSFGETSSKWARLARGEGLPEAVVKSNEGVLRSVASKIAKTKARSTDIKMVGRTSEGEAVYYSKGAGLYWSENEAGLVLAGKYLGRKGVGGESATLGASRQGIFSRLMDVVEKKEPDVVLNMAKETDISGDMQAWIMKRAKQHLIDETPTFDGMKLQDLLPEGTEPLKKILDYGAGEARLRPDLLIPRELLLGDVPMETLKDLAKQAMEAGATPDLARETVLTRAWNSSLRATLRSLASKNIDVGPWFERYLTKVGTIRRVELTGRGAVLRIHKIAASIWGDDSAKFNYWSERLLRYQMRAGQKIQSGVDRMSALTSGRAQELQALEDWTGGQWNDYLDTTKQLFKDGVLDEKSAAEVAQSQANREQMRSVLADLQKQYDEDFQAATKAATQYTDTQELADIITEMYEDYNRTYLATNPEWAYAIDEKTGLVKWDELNKGLKRSKDEALQGEGTRSVIPQTVRDMAKEMDVDPEKLAQQLMQAPNSVMSLELPIDPLKMVMARETGGAKYIKLTHKARVSEARESAFAIHRLWMVDKVFRASTAMTVSFDELLRIWHIGGMQAVDRWMRDRALYMRARGETLLHEGTFKQGVQKGAKYLSKKSQERIRVLQDYPSYLKQAERQFYDGNGLGWADITPDMPEYVDAAHQWTGGFLQDSGFRAYLRGPEEFQKWFFGPDGERLRKSIVLTKDDATKSMSTRLISNSDDAYRGWHTLFDDVILKTARENGKYAEVRAAFEDIAQRIEEGGGVARELPDFVFDNLGPVRGMRKEMGLKTLTSSLTEKFFDNLFMKPVNYRRGFLAELVRKSERARLEELFASQGKRLMSDTELAAELNLRGLAGIHRVGGQYVLEDVALRNGMVSEGMVSRMVEQQVERELENVLFTWDQGTRAGTQAQAIFPFGRPYADMMGFWGRELLRRPVLRGLVNEKNFLGLRSLNERGLIPFNPKTGALISRLANTDFTIDHGVLGGAFGTDRKNQGILPGSSKSSFTPLFFLPTGGENPFASLIPGLGILPMWAIDRVIDSKDPVKDPEGYQKLLDNLSDFLPSVKYQQGSTISRLGGGGTAFTTLEAAVDAIGLGNRGKGSMPYYNFTSELGDITREVSMTRAVSSLLADPEELDVLLNAGSAEEVDGLLLALTRKADSMASGQNLAKSGSHWVLAATNHYDTTIADIMDVWVEASKRFPELAVRPTLRDADLTNEDLRRQYAADVRKAYFSLPQWKRDLLVAQQPTLAVNLVSSWEWTTSGVAAGLPGTDKSYRTGGTHADSVRHQYYINKGYIRPLQPIERARRILGMMNAAKESAAKHTYEQAATEINDVVWDEDVSDQYKKWLDDIAASDFGSKWDLRSGRELWENWGSMEKKLEADYARQEGLDPESDAVKDAIKLPSKMKAWGHTWPGVNPAEVTDKFGGVAFNEFSDELKQSAAALGIELTPGETGSQLYNDIQAIITENTKPAFEVARNTYNTYVSVRSQPAESARQTLVNASFNQKLDPNWRQGVTEFVRYADSVSERYRNVIGGIPLDEQEEVVKRFNALRTTAGDDLGIPWEKVWSDRYAGSYGPLEWTMPEPAKPIDSEGNRSPNAYTPEIVYQQDGDSLVVKLDPNDTRTVGVRLLGVRARDFGSDTPGAIVDKRLLADAIQEAVKNGVTIWLVRDPETFGTNTDYYGRMLAWLWFGDKPYYYSNDFRRNQTSSGSGS